MISMWWLGVVVWFHSLVAVGGAAEQPPFLTDAGRAEAARIFCTQQIFVDDESSESDGVLHVILRGKFENIEISQNGVRQRLRSAMPNGGPIWKVRPWVFLGRNRIQNAVYRDTASGIIPLQDRWRAPKVGDFVIQRVTKQPLAVSIRKAPSLPEIHDQVGSFQSSERAFSDFRGPYSGLRVSFGREPHQDSGTSQNGGESSRPTLSIQTKEVIFWGGWGLGLLIQSIGLFLRNRGDFGWKPWGRIGWSIALCGMGMVASLFGLAIGQHWI